MRSGVSWIRWRRTKGRLKTIKSGGALLLNETALSLEILTELGFSLCLLYDSSKQYFQRTEVFGFVVNVPWD